MTPIEFLLARITEDEDRARAIERAEYFHGVDSDAEEEVLFFADPQRALAECAAKRRVVESLILCPTVDEFEATRECLEDVCRDLATVYAGHPDYPSEWDMAEPEAALASVWDEGHRAGVWNSASPRQSQGERKNPYRHAAHNTNQDA